MWRALRYAVLGVLLVGVTAVPALATSKTTLQRENGLEQAIAREVNRVRSEHGLRQLASSGGLRAAATFQSRALLNQGVFEHDSAQGGPFGDRLRRFYPVGSSPSWSVGENLLWSSLGIEAAEAVKLWLGSPSHRKIMLDPTWREFGLAAISAPSASGVYSVADGPVVVVTMDFGVRGGRSTSSVTRR